MHLSAKLSLVLMVLSSGLHACGGLRRSVSEPDEKTSSGFGSCTNFQGHWLNACDQSNFYVTQLGCDQFIINEHELSIESGKLNWSESREAVALGGRHQETLLLKKVHGVKQGAWIRGQQLCAVTQVP